jgi:LCP family protein required for cell wall assembly
VARARGRSAFAAAALSLVPGAGHAYVGARRRALAFGATALLLLVAAAVAVPAAPAHLGPGLLVAVLAANAAVLAFRALAVVDAWRLGASGAAAALALVLAVVAVPHAAAAYVAIRGYGVASAVFAEREPTDVLGGDGLFVAVPPLGVPPKDLDPPALRPTRAVPDPRPKPFRGVPMPLADAAQILESEEPELSQPWVTFLLLGSDRGPRQPGDRTDTMIVAAIQRDTGRAVLFGVPRNIVGVSLGEHGRFNGLLNALYRYARSRPQLFPGGSDPGATALKQAISRLLGLRIDYHALVDLDGFVDLVDALGGVEIHVKERIVDEVTRPAWRETKPRIDVHPGRRYRFTGRTALAYVRSRKASNDYRRMARQRCFVTALADQLDPKRVLLHFGSIAGAIESSVRTDIPLNRVPDLLGLVTSIDRRQTLTQTFGPPYFAGRRADGFPYPNVGKIRATVRDAILHPERARAARGVDTVARSC